jgi:hypothetical protein
MAQMVANLTNRKKFMGDFNRIGRELEGRRMMQSTDPQQTEEAPIQVEEQPQQIEQPEQVSETVPQQEVQAEPVQEPVAQPAPAEVNPAPEVSTIKKVDAILKKSIVDGIKRDADNFVAEFEKMGTADWKGGDVSVTLPRYLQNSVLQKLGVIAHKAMPKMFSVNAKATIAMLADAAGLKSIGSESDVETLQNYVGGRLGPISPESPTKMIASVPAGKVTPVDGATRVGDEVIIPNGKSATTSPGRCDSREYHISSAAHMPIMMICMRLCI